MLTCALLLTWPRRPTQLSPHPTPSLGLQLGSPPALGRSGGGFVQRLTRGQPRSSSEAQAPSREMLGRDISSHPILGLCPSLPCPS